ncbi:MAG: hypothetical protein PHR28_00385 [candidate division Zixibacteria bacterium]|nr:hypothetical protein [candidate division Zixibacteria bacterium]
MKTRYRRPIPTLLFAVMALLIASAPLAARPDFRLLQPPSALAKPSAGLPNVSLEVHKINRMGLAITNNGYFGTGYFPTTPLDPETGKQALACEYPLNSDIETLWIGALWIGAVVGRDTLVSTAAEDFYLSSNIVEFWPDAGEAGRIIRRSTQPFSRYYSTEAVSEEDIIVQYTDTLADPSLISMDPMDNRPHIPLNIAVTQSSYAWSYPYAEDFVLLDYKIKNIGPFPLKKLYIGILVDADVYHISQDGGTGSWLDDICGYKEVIPSPIWPGYEDTVRVAWTADNDGDPSVAAGGYDFSSCTGVAATRVIRTPSDSLRYSFNWWVTDYSTNNDWGPRQVTADKPFRSFGPTMGSPVGDRNKYYVLSTPETDYDQMESAVPHTGAGWLPPPRDADDYAKGQNSIYLLSFGPFDVAPESVLPVTLSYIGGENFHHNPRAFEDIFTPLAPGPYQSQFDFSDLGLNSMWADWIYDNPGYDTDNDAKHDSGLARWFVNTTGTDSTYAFFKGDGVPDFRGAAPPPSPRLKVLTEYGKLILRWNGQTTENAVDIFSKTKDFEGYKVYYGEDNRFSDFVLLATYDQRDYNRYQWNSLLQRWENSPAPLTYDSLQIIYGAAFDPDLYTAESPMAPDDPQNPDNVYTYFTPQDWNQSDLSNPTGIHRVYPEADRNDLADTTEEGYHRYYEYEYVIDNLPPSRPVYVAVTAFDYGSRSYFLTALESSVMTNATLAYPMAGTDAVENEGLSVYVFPNPYRIDGGYARAGYENRDRTKSAERSRAVHFANLPRICTIRIYTVSGDLVQQIDHYQPEGGPQAMQETWNLISRNTQAITTGLYIWSVTSPMGDQLGKLLIIK